MIHFGRPVRTVKIFTSRINVAKKKVVRIAFVVAVLEGSPYSARAPVTTPRKVIMKVVGAPLAHFFHHFLS